ncbi:MAG: hypothetical protein V1779_07925 [bacterium]
MENLKETATKTLNEAEIQIKNRQNEPETYNFLISYLKETKIITELINKNKKHLANFFNSNRKSVEIEELIQKKIFSLLNSRFLIITQRRVLKSGVDFEELKKDKEDIVQNAMLKISKNYLKINYKIGFYYWALKVLYNKTGDYYRERLKYSYFNDNVVEILTSIDDAISYKEIENVIEVLEGNRNTVIFSIRDCILKCLKKLNKDCQRFFRLFLDEGLDKWEMCVAFYSIFNPDDYSKEQQEKIIDKFNSKKSYCKSLFLELLQKAKCVELKENKKDKKKSKKVKKGNKNGKKNNKNIILADYIEGEAK